MKKTALSNRFCVFFLMLSLAMLFVGEAFAGSKSYSERKKIKSKTSISKSNRSGTKTKVKYKTKRTTRSESLQKSGNKSHPTFSKRSSQSSKSSSYKSKSTKPYVSKTSISGTETTSSSSINRSIKKYPPKRVSHPSKHHSQKSTRIKKNQNRKISVYHPEKPKRYKYRKHSHHHNKYNKIRHHGNHYYYRHGKFHRKHRGSYVRISAPLGALVWGLPFGYVTVRVGLGTYYYYDGIYYEKHHSNYKVIQPPHGIFVPILPDGYTVHYTLNTLFFELNGVYYQRWNEGYITTSNPYENREHQESNQYNSDAITILIENSNGSRTPVTLEKMGPYQYRGQKGEIYDGMPSEEQLRMAYGF